MDLNTFKPLILWLHQHPHWGGFVAFLFAFTESIAVIGLVVPGTVIMSAIGLLIGAGIVPATSTFIWAISGAFLGDLISYGFGYYYHGHIRRIWPFRLVPKWMDKGEQFFEAHGGKGIFAGRFIGPIRPILPVIAGMMKMRPIRFIPIDLCSAILWAPIYMLPGILIATASIAIAPEQATRLIIYLVIALVILWLVYWFLKKVILWVCYGINSWLQKQWFKLYRHQVGSKYWHKLRIPSRSHDHSQLTWLLLGVVCFTLFLVVTFNVTTQTGLSAINIPLHHLLRTLYQPIAQHIFIAITFIGTPKALVFLWAVICLWLLFQRDMPSFLHWLILGFFAIGMAGTFKRLVESPRPLGLLDGPSNWSFPSGHTTLSTAFFTFIAVMLCRYQPKAIKWLATLIIIVLITSIGASRLYLGVHWPTDIIGGVLLGMSLVLFISVSYRRYKQTNFKRLQLLIVVLITIALYWSFFMFKDFHKMQVNLTPVWPRTTETRAIWWQEGLANSPLVRNNHFGRPVQTLNVEWLSPLAKIKQSLTQKGWQEANKSRIIHTINYLGSENHSRMLPLVHNVYLDRLPSLIMTKQVGKEKRLIILRLWRSGVTITPGKIQLWVGTIDTRRDFHRRSLLEYLEGKMAPQSNFKPAVTFLINDLTDFHTKQLPYPDWSSLNDKQDISWRGFVLLVKPKS